MSIELNIAEEYTKTPGGRHKAEGKYSGEEFREVLLRPAFIKAKETNDELVVDLDGGYGYATSFLEEAFGGLARETQDPAVLNIRLISDEEPSLIEKILQYMKAALREKI
jgi:hypothetical protein